MTLLDCSSVRRLACLGVLGWVVGVSSSCRAPAGPAPFELPRLQVSTSHRFGALLSGAIPSAEVREEGRDLQGPDLAVSVRWFVLGELPQGLGAEGLATHAEVVARVGGGRALAPTPRLGRYAVVLSPEQGGDPVAQLQQLLPQRIQEVPSLPAALAAGLTAAFELSDPAAARLLERGVAGTASVRVLVHAGMTDPAGPPAVRVALELTGWLPQQALDEDSGQGAATSSRRAAPQASSSSASEAEIVEPFRELIVLADSVPVDGTGLLLALPLSFASGTAQGVAVLLDVRSAPTHEVDPGGLFAEALDRRRSELDSAVSAPEASAATFVGLTEAFVSLETPSMCRAALAHLARRTHAKLTADVALVVQQELLDDYVAQFLESNPQGPEPGDDGRRLGWALERQTLQWFSVQLTQTAPQLGLEAVLLRHLGETARHPSYVKRLADRVGSLEELDERMVEQNLIWLEDPSPAARIRAFDWLTERGRAPPDFDPLGARSDRRAALAAFRKAQS